MKTKEEEHLPHSWLHNWMHGDQHLIKGHGHPKHRQLSIPFKSTNLEETFDPYWADEVFLHSRLLKYSYKASNVEAKEMRGKIHT